MIRSLYPEIAQRVQDAIAREGRFMLPDIALVEHIIDLVDDEVVACVDAIAAADLHPHDLGPSVPVAIAPPAVVTDAPVAPVDVIAHDAPAG